VVKNSTITENTVFIQGGGLYNFQQGTIAISDSKISQNTAGQGGGIFIDDGTVTVAESAITQNTATVWGGGIFNAGAVAVNHSLITRNTAGTDGGGIYTALDGGGIPPKLRNSIVADNTPNDVVP